MLLDFILSGGMSSRLYKKMRNERGIGYDLGSTYDDFGGIGVFLVRLDGFDPTRFQEAKEVILNELEDLKTNLVSKREFVRAKNTFFSNYDDDLAGLKDRVELLSNAYFQEDFFDCRYLKREIEKISRKALRRTAKKYFGKNYTLAALVPENFETTK